MNKAAAPQRKKRKDFIPYFLGFVIFLYCTVQLVSFTAKAADQKHRARLRRALGKVHSSENMCILISSSRSPCSVYGMMSRWDWWFTLLTVSPCACVCVCCREWDGLRLSSVLGVPRRLFHGAGEERWRPGHLLHDHLLHAAGRLHRLWRLLSPVFGGDQWT